jgi:hypothetical protein
MENSFKIQDFGPQVILVEQSLLINPWIDQVANGACSALLAGAHITLIWEQH